MGNIEKNMDFMSRESETEEESLGERKNHTIVTAIPVIAGSKIMRRVREKMGSNNARKFIISTLIKRHQNEFMISSKLSENSRDKGAKKGLSVELF